MNAYHALLLNLIQQHHCSPPNCLQFRWFSGKLLWLRRNVDCWEPHRAQSGRRKCWWLAECLPPRKRWSRFDTSRASDIVRRTSDRCAASPTCWTTDTMHTAGVYRLRQMVPPPPARWRSRSTFYCSAHRTAEIRRSFPEILLSVLIQCGCQGIYVFVVLYDLNAMNFVTDHIDEVLGDIQVPQS